MAIISFDDLLKPKIPDWLDKALEWQESRGNPKAVSPKGAFGLRQIMPATAADPGFGIKPFDFNAPDQDAENVRFGRDYLGTMLERYDGDIPSALVAYNAGPAYADKWVASGRDRNRLYKETQGYVNNIMAQEPAEAPVSRALTFDDLLKSPAGGEVSEAEANSTLTPEEQSKVAAVSSAEEGMSLGGFAENLGTNAADIASGAATAIGNVVSDPQGSIDALLNASIEDWENVIKGGLRKSGGDLGFYFKPDKSVGWSGEKLADRAYKRPLDVALSASMVTPAGVNPLSLGARGVAKAGGAVVGKPLKYAAGELSGIGPRAISEAYKSGRAGGTQGEAFRAGMRGDLDPDAPVEEARAAVRELKDDRKAAYLQGKETWKDTPGTMSPMTSKRLAWDPVEAAYESVLGVRRYRNKDIQPSVAKTRGEVRSILDEWKKDPGSWTPEGFDALKQRLQDYQKTLDPMTQGAARSVVGAVTQAVRRQIAKQAPDYAKTMKAYERASNAIDEVQRTLSLGNKASHDTALRKLQSVLRNNALTNWSAREKLANLIAEKAPELMPMLAGQAANTWTPRGLVGKLLGYGTSGAAGYAAMGLEPMSLLTFAGTAAASSPRVVGEVAHGLGRVRSAFDRAPSYTSPAVAGLLALNPYLEE